MYIAILFAAWFDQVRTFFCVHINGITVFVYFLTHYFSFLNPSPAVGGTLLRQTNRKQVKSNGNLIKKNLIKILLNVWKC